MQKSPPGLRDDEEAEEEVGKGGVGEHGDQWRAACHAHGHSGMGPGNRSYALRGIWASLDIDPWTIHLAIVIDVRVGKRPDAPSPLLSARPSIAARTSVSGECPDA
ncbi:hypothetical protein NMY22_g12331 [Coprinellus aureogranulatus]|nr:hypothetical protein NMY22_g12331 [Coprinellus aureogranulatus]